MSTKVKSVNAKATPAAVAAPKAAPVAATPAPAPKKTAAKKEEVVAATTETAATPAAEDRFNDFAKKISSLQETVKTLTTALSTLSKEFNALQKASVKELKEASKKGGRRGKKQAGAAGARTGQSGLTKPTALSAELCTFLGIPVGSQIGRSEVAKNIHAYVVKHGLQKQENKKIILPDATMKKLLNIQNGEELSYFNIMHYLKTHFIKNTVATA